MNPDYILHFRNKNDFLLHFCKHKLSLALMIVLRYLIT